MISLEYLAGMIDADGYFGIVYNKKQNWYNLRMTITNVDTNLLLLIQKDFGGKIYYKHFLNPNHRNQFIIQWNGKDVLNILNKIKNILIVKKDQCKVALKFKMDGDKETKEHLMKELSKLKHKIHDVPDDLKDKSKKEHKEKIRKQYKSIELRKQGLSQLEIGRIVGVSQAMVSEYLK